MIAAVIGSGSWGTALAVLLGGKGYEVRLWGLPDEAASISADRENKRYLPGITLPQTVSPTEDMNAALDGVNAIVLAVPSGGLRAVLPLLKGKVASDALLVNAGKGLECDTGLRGSQVVADELGGDIGPGCVVLSGPNLAVELANNVPTATVVASRDSDRAARAQHMFSSSCLRVYRNTDVVGVELGGALKNVMAIGAGISDGLGYGDNTKATLVTRGLAEMTRLGVALGGQPSTFSGLSGFGDLMATCASRLSRNLRLGRMLGEGKDVDESLAVLGQVAEGMPTCRAALLLSKRYDVYMPITEQIHAILYERKSPLQGVRDLMSRDSKDEW